VYYFERDKFEMIKNYGVKIITFLLVLFVFIEKMPFVGFSKITFYIYIIRPIIYLFFIFLILKLPRVKFENKLRYKNSIMWWIIYLALVQCLIKFLGGFIDGYGKNPFNTTKTGIIINFFIFGTIFIGQEFVRSYILNNFKKEFIYLKIIIISILIGLLNTNLAIFTSKSSKSDIIIYTFSEFLPKMIFSFVASYLVIMGGALYSLIYVLITNMVFIIIPVLPNLTWILKSFIGITIPLCTIFILQYIYSKMLNKNKLKDRKKENYFSWVLTGLISVSIVWFTIGVFPIYPSVIITGSMEPLIKPGDMVIVKKIEGENAKMNDIVEFRSDNVSVFHRIIDVENINGNREYVTKGDNNSNPDSSNVKYEDVKGKVLFVIPKMGLPTLFIRDRNNQEIKNKFEN
jgi:signal peptidase